MVGNGGSTLLYELGALIDSHDLVIRLNSGPTSGFEKHVGNKTGVRLVNRLGKAPSGSDACHGTYPCQMYAAERGDNGCPFGAHVPGRTSATASGQLSRCCSMSVPTWRCGSSCA